MATPQILYVGLGEQLKLFDVSSPDAPAEAGTYAVSASALLLAGNILYVGTFDGRLVMMDVTDPASPQQVNEIPMAGLPIRMFQSGNRLYVAARTAGLLIYDITAPASPVLLSQYLPASRVYDVEVAGNLAFLAAAEAGLVVADVSDAAHPVFVSGTRMRSNEPFFPIDGGSKATSVALHEGIVFVGTLDGNGMVAGYDYANPALPRLVALNVDGDFIDTLVTKIDFAGDDAFVAGFLGDTLGVSQDDASEPRNAIDFYDLPEIFRYRPPASVAATAGAGRAAGAEGARTSRYGPLPAGSARSVGRPPRDGPFPAVRSSFGFLEGRQRCGRLASEAAQGSNSSPDGSKKKDP